MVNINHGGDPMSQPQFEITTPVTFFGVSETFSLTAPEFEVRLTDLSEDNGGDNQFTAIASDFVFVPPVFSDLTIVQDGADVLITSSEFAGTSSIRLLNETAADIDADQFEFSGSSALVVGDTDGFGLNFLTEFSGPSEVAAVSSGTELAGLSSLFDEADFGVFHQSFGSEFTYDLA